MGAGFLDTVGAYICWLYDRLRGRKTSLREELGDTFATRHLVAGFLAGLVMTILLVALQ